MPSAAFNKVNGFVENLSEGFHDMGSDTFSIALSNTAPSDESTDPSVLTADCILANVTEIDYSNLSSRALVNVTGSQTGGVYTFDADNITLVSTGGTTGPFRYVYIYNETTVGDPLLGYFDYGSSLTLEDGGQLLPRRQT